jgi:hypothetical protein
LGDGTNYNNFIPNKVNFENVEKICAGFLHSLLIQNGTVFGTGFNSVWFNEANHLRMDNWVRMTLLQKHHGPKFLEIITLLK